MPLVSGKLSFILSFVATRSGGCSVSALGRIRREMYAEYMSIKPKITAMTLGDMRAVKYAPTSAPRVVAISRNIPMRMLEKPSLTYAAAEPEEVAITETSDAPIA